ncbi:restriction endonuclease subunit S [Eggerthellaceae bacterium zg-887]|uniref:restriction endonuclease subunit S n=1 Tax=Xiamenia xianingshaonis TaxID=2682776 RepID=UPI001408BAB2|nr:restriction endonuclease subunit S [Xiamenia xianingshaonis]NHM16491.1 restriction endonuclease subunit S [Xiamenia xianingshaonis]
MERYDSYKDSGIEWIGEIPSHWRSTRISSLCDSRNEKASDKDYRPLSVTMKGIVPQLETAAKTQDGDNRKLVRRGDFVINSRSDRRGSCGISPMDGSVSLISNVLAPKNSLMVSEYFEYLFRTEAFADEFYKWGTGIVDDLWSTNWTRMKNILVCLPDKHEQKAIADYLDVKTAEIDSLIEKTERSIELLEEYRKSVISEAVTKGLNPDAPMKDSGIEWIGEIPAHWEIAKSTNLGTTTLGRMLDKSTASGPNMCPYLSNKNIQWFEIRTDNLNEMSFPEDSDIRYGIKDGDILICEGGEVGRCAVWRGDSPDFYFQKAIHRFRIDATKANSEYIAFQLYQKASVTNFAEVRKGESTIAHLPGDQLNSLRYLLPPLEEQYAIAIYLTKHLESINHLIHRTEVIIELLREYRKSLISEAVTGKFKVPGVK